MPRDPRHQGGFTLIELLVVLAIISLAIGLTLPLLSRGTARTSLAAATRELRTALGDARIAAITADRPVVFRGDGAAGYWVDDRHYRLAAGSAAQLQVVTAGNTPIEFYASGAASGGRVLVRGRGGAGALRIDPLTGRADAVR